MIELQAFGERDISQLLAAIACYQKAGFRHEGVLRDARRMGGEFWSLCMMSILEREWRESESATSGTMHEVFD